MAQDPRGYRVQDNRGRVIFLGYIVMVICGLGVLRTTIQAIFAPKLYEVTGKLCPPVDDELLALKAIRSGCKSVLVRRQDGTSYVVRLD